MYITVVDILLRKGACVKQNILIVQRMLGSLTVVRLSIPVFTPGGSHKKKGCLLIL
jgi:hypothetical protein